MSKGQMKPKDRFIDDIRQEYLMLCSKIAKAEFALITFPFDEIEMQLLEKQLKSMKDYAQALLYRVKYANFEDASEFAELAIEGDKNE